MNYQPPFFHDLFRTPPDGIVESPTNEQRSMGVRAPCSTPRTNYAMFETPSPQNAICNSNHPGGTTNAHDGSTSLTTRYGLYETPSQEGQRINDDGDLPSPTTGYVVYKTPPSDRHADVIGAVQTTDHAKASTSRTSTIALSRARWPQQGPTSLATIEKGALFLQSKGDETKQEQQEEKSSFPSNLGSHHADGIGAEKTTDDAKLSTPRTSNMALSHARAPQKGPTSLATIEKEALSLQSNGNEIEQEQQEGKSSFPSSLGNDDDDNVNEEGEGASTQRGLDEKTSQTPATSNNGKNCCRRRSVNNSPLLSTSLAEKVQGNNIEQETLTLAETPAQSSAGQRKNEDNDPTSTPAKPRAHSKKGRSSPIAKSRSKTGLRHDIDSENKSPAKSLPSIYKSGCRSSSAPPSRQRRRIRGGSNDRDDESEFNSDDEQEYRHCNDLTQRQIRKTPVAKPTASKSKHVHFDDEIPAKACARSNKVRHTSSSRSTPVKPRAHSKKGSSSPIAKCRPKKGLRRDIDSDNESSVISRTRRCKNGCRKSNTPVPRQKGRVQRGSIDRDDESQFNSDDELDFHHRNGRIQRRIRKTREVNPTASKEKHVDVDDEIPAKACTRSNKEVRHPSSSNPNASRNRGILDLDVASARPSLNGSIRHRNQDGIIWSCCQCGSNNAIFEQREIPEAIDLTGISDDDDGEEREGGGGSSSSATVCVCAAAGSNVDAYLEWAKNKAKNEWFADSTLSKRFKQRGPEYWEQAKAIENFDDIILDIQKDLDVLINRVQVSYHAGAGLDRQVYGANKDWVKVTFKKWEDQNYSFLLPGFQWECDKRKYILEIIEQYEKNGVVNRDDSDLTNETRVWIKRMLTRRVPLSERIKSQRPHDVIRDLLLDLIRIDTLIE